MNALKRSTEFLKGAIPALIVALILVGAVEVYLPSRSQYQTNAEISLAPLVALRISHNGGTLYLQALAIAIAILLSLFAYLYIRKGYE